MRFFMVGTAAVPLYLYRLDDGWALFEGGLTVNGPLVLTQLRDIVGDLSAVRWWFINHTHYDHCALVPQLIGHFPEAVVLVSDFGAKAFRSPRAQRVIATLNQSVMRAQGCERFSPDGQRPDVAWEALPVRTLDNGECLRLCRETTVHALSTPGHSRCSMSYLLEPAGILIVSDALGEIVAEGRFLPLVLEDVLAYRYSLETLAALNPALVGLGHQGILTGALARSAARDSAAGLERLQETVRRRAQGGGGELTALAGELTEAHWQSSSEFLPKELHQKSMVRMVELLQ